MKQKKTKSSLSASKKGGTSRSSSIRSLKEEIGRRIQKEIAPPPKRKRALRHGHWVNVLRAMSVGDSFLVEDRKKAMCAYIAAQRLDLRITWQKQSSGEYRIWRIAKEKS